MQKINFRNGYHLDLTTMNFMQDSYRKPMSAMAASPTAQSYIFSGVEWSEAGAIVTVSPGYIVLNGELMEFRGGTWNGNDEDSEYYVVKRIEYGANENSDGQTDSQALETPYATLSAEQPGAVSMYVLKDYRMIHYVTHPTVVGDVVTSYLATGDWTRLGFATQKDSVPRYTLSDNHISFHGAFRMSNGTTMRQRIFLGTVPNWIGVKVNGIKCTMICTDATDIYFSYAGLADLDEDGVLWLRMFKQDSISSSVGLVAATFDDTPYLAIR